MTYCPACHSGVAVGALRHRELRWTEALEAAREDGLTAVATAMLAGHGTRPDREPAALPR